MFPKNPFQTRRSWLFLLLTFFAQAAGEVADAKYMRRERPPDEPNLGERPNIGQEPITTLVTTAQPSLEGQQLAEMRRSGEAVDFSSDLQGKARAQFEKEEAELWDARVANKAFPLGQAVPTHLFKQAIDLPEGKTMDQVAAELDEASLLDQGLSAEEEAKKLERVATSFRHYQQTAVQLDRWLENYYKKEDLMDEHGFEVDKIGKAARIQRLQDVITKNRDDSERRLEEEAKKKFEQSANSSSKNHVEPPKKKSSAALIEKETTKKNTKVGMVANHSAHGKHSTTGDHAWTSGFFAKDRPNEERLDPENMKVYKFNDYRVRFSSHHSFEVENMWKKLPVAPKQIHKVKLENAVRKDKDGYSLVDEKGEELVFQKDNKGFYHQGMKEITQDDTMKASQPLNWLKQHQVSKWHKQNDRYLIYPSYTSLIQDKMKEVEDKSRDMYQREVSLMALENLMYEMRIGAHMNFKKHGKAKISVHGMEGYLTGFNAEISKVTVWTMKQRIENLTGIPAESQRILLGLEELHNEDLLNKRIPPMGVTVDLMRKDWVETRDSLHHRREMEKEKEKEKEREKAEKKRYTAKRSGRDQSDTQKDAAASSSQSSKTRIAERLADLRVLRTMRLHEKSDSESGNGKKHGILKKKGRHHRKKHRHRERRGGTSAAMSEMYARWREKKAERQKDAIREAKLKAANLLETEAKAGGHATNAAKEELKELNELRLPTPGGSDPYYWELIHDPAKYVEKLRHAQRLKKLRRQPKNQTTVTAALTQKEVRLHSHEASAALTQKDVRLHSHEASAALQQKEVRFHSREHEAGHAQINASSNIADNRINASRPHKKAQKQQRSMRRKRKSSLRELGMRPKRSGGSKKLRVVQYVREADGHVHVEKERVATDADPIPDGFTFGKIDRGVSVMDRIAEEHVVADSTPKKRSSSMAIQ